ncbi:Alpha/Beta hydrolase protein [Dendryphion nanum]|uniref:Alpha/Beta hydrolase protein n=1 Tax=Dendryphion nanum TaxID=256645 RepID=A0A9P9EB08_9PLEO|nr:Alpha/Beta hydrolase protein [Dendryphion nanum]
MPATSTTAEVVQSELEAVQPYSMHVSSKYLELTNKKLQLTRLPREIELPDEKRWDYGTPKSVLEPLLDFWLEKYDWRTQEQLFNTTLPQFRTTVKSPPPSTDAAGTSSSLRIHFVHKRSTHKDAIPLLFCHTWPASFIEVHKIIDALTEPQSLPGYDSGAQVAFHVVAPSIPGFGFSDSSSHYDFGARQTADAFHQVMETLGYTTYVSHGTGWGFNVCRALALGYPQSCMAVHTANPSFAEPTMRRTPAAWMKYQVARWTRGKISSLNFGYLPAEVEASEYTEQGSVQKTQLTGTHKELGIPTLASLHAQRPQTLAFSLCDSPIGLLASLLDSVHTRDSSGASLPARAQSPFLSPSELEMQEVQEIRHARSSRHESEIKAQSYTWTPTELLNWTMLQWLPGPEASLRWLRCASVEASTTSAFSTAYCEVPLGISSFRGGDGGSTSDNRNSSSKRRRAAHTPLMWGSAVWNLVWTKRHQHRASISAAWEAADLLVVDMREYFGSVVLASFKERQRE